MFFSPTDPLSLYHLICNFCQLYIFIIYLQATQYQSFCKTITLHHTFIREEGLIATKASTNGNTSPKGRLKNCCLQLQRLWWWSWDRSTSITFCAWKDPLQFANLTFCAVEPISPVVYPDEGDALLQSQGKMHG